MIVITTPTGQIGSRVARALVDANEPVRVVVRETGKLDPVVRERAEVIEGSHGDPAVVDRAFAGADALFWVAPNLVTETVDESFLDFTRPAVEAIRKHGVARIVDVTSLGRGTGWENDAGLVTASLRMDDLLMSSGAAFRGLAMPSFMENIARQVQPMKAKGMFFSPIDPDKKLPWIAVRDMAAVATALLGDAGWSGQEQVPVVGPDDLSYDDIATIVSEASGRDIRFQQTGWDQFKQGFLDRGASETFAQGYLDMYRAKGAGMDNVAATQAADRQPTSFRRWAEEKLAPALAE